MVHLVFASLGFPTSWDIVPRAWSTFVTYITFHIPPASNFRPYDPLQQLTYAAVIYLLGPFLIVTGAAMSPAIEARFPGISRYSVGVNQHAVCIY